MAGHALALAASLVAFPAAQEPGDDARPGAVVTLDDHFPFTPPADLEQWSDRREELRRQVLVAAGLWPMPPRSPLEPVIHGRVEREGYTVEKVSLQSWLGFYVTGNLYRPLGQGPFAGVLCPHGHWTDGRFSERPTEEVEAQIARGEEVHLANGRYHLQARCAQLARMGCVVFHYDMVGYADSRQLDHREDFGTVETELWLQSHFGLQTWNSIRALDFLAGLPGVDPQRLGVTGGSGGGTQTFVLGAVDERPAALFPAVMVSTAMQGGCVCENASHLRIGTGNVELAALAAPRPLAMTGANDWTIDIERDGLPELKRVYALYGAEDDVAAWCYPNFEHNYNLVSRLRMYAWFNRHLELGHTEPIVERPLVPIPPRELSVFDERHPRPAGARDAAELRWLMTSVARRQMEALVPDDAGELEEFRSVVGGALEVLLHARRVDPADLTVTARALEGVSIRRASRPEILLRLRRPEVWNGVVVVDTWGRDSADPSLFARTEATLVSIAGSRPANEPPADPARHDRYVGYTYGYNPTVLARRVDALLTAIAYARSLPDTRSVRLLGRGEASSAVVLAAALAGDAVDRVLVEWGWDFDRVEGFDDPGFLPGGMKYGGMDAFAALCAPAELVLIGGDEVPSITARVYGAAGATGSVRALRGMEPRALAQFLAHP